MADNMFLAEVLKGITNGYVTGMQLKQQKEASAQDAALKQQQIDISKMGQEQEGQYRNSMIDIENKKLQLEREKLRNQNTKESLSPGQKRMDMAFGTKATDWENGGRATAEKNFQAIDEAISQLEPTKDEKGNIVKGPVAKPGPLTGWMPEGLRSVVDKKTQANIELARGPVIGLLRETLGAQFTQQEGERIFNLNYNPSLPPEENAKKLKALRSQLQASIEAKENMMDYFVNNNQSLKGYKGPKLVTVAGKKYDITKTAMDKKQEMNKSTPMSTTPSLLPEEEIINGYIVNHKTNSVRALNANSNL